MKRVVSVLTYGLFLYLVLEITLRVCFSIPSLVIKLSDNEENTWQRNWVNSHQDGQLEFKLDRFDRTKGWVSKPNAEIEVLNGDSLLTYSINKSGLRGEQIYPYKRTPGKFRVLMIGDSFTFGEGVNNKETFSHYLQEMLPEAEVINLGVHGYGHDQILIHLQEEGVKYQPDLVVLGFVDADMERNRMNFRDYAKPKFVLKGGDLKLTNSPVPSPEELLKWDWLRQRSATVFSFFKFKLAKENGTLKKQEEAITDAILKEIFKTVESINAIPSVVYIPYGEQMHDKADQINSEKFLFKVCEDAKVSNCFSARPAFKSYKEKGVEFTSTGHHHWIGNYVVAESIKDFIVENNIYPDSLTIDLKRLK